MHLHLHFPWTGNKYSTYISVVRLYEIYFTKLLSLYNTCVYKLILNTSKKLYKLKRPTIAINVWHALKWPQKYFQNSFSKNCHIFNRKAVDGRGPLLFICLLFFIRSRIFCSYGDFTIDGEGPLFARRQGLWAGRDFYRATFGLGFFNRSNKVPFTTWYGHREPILSRIWEGQVLNKRVY